VGDYVSTPIAALAYLPDAVKSPQYKKTMDQALKALPADRREGTVIEKH
jgi:hypothetical protein